MNNLSKLTDYDYDNCGPFVYDTYATTTTENPPNDDNNNIAQKQKQLIVEELSGCESEGVTNVFTVADVFTHSQCREIIDYITKNSALWKEERDLRYTFLSMKEMVVCGVLGASHIDELIFKRVNAVLNAFRENRSEFKGEQDDGYTLHRIIGGDDTNRQTFKPKYKTGGFTKFVRALSFIAVLNDDYDGGIFNFPNQNLKFKVKKGDVVLFPPYWTHPHSVTSVGEDQARYTINTCILENFVD